MDKIQLATALLATLTGKYHGLNAQLGTEINGQFIDRWFIFLTQKSWVLVHESMSPAPSMQWPLERDQAYRLLEEVVYHDNPNIFTDVAIAIDENNVQRVLLGDKPLQIPTINYDEEVAWVKSQAQQLLN